MNRCPAATGVTQYAANCLSARRSWRSARCRGVIHQRGADRTPPPALGPAFWAAVSDNDEIGFQTLCVFADLLDRFAACQVSLCGKSALAQHLNALFEHLAVVLGFVGGVGHLGDDHLIQNRSRDRLHHRDQVNVGLAAIGEVGTFEERGATALRTVIRKQNFLYMMPPDLVALRGPSAMRTALCSSMTRIGRANASLIQLWFGGIWQRSRVNTDRQRYASAPAD